MKKPDTPLELMTDKLAIAVKQLEDYAINQTIKENINLSLSIGQGLESYLNSINVFTHPLTEHIRFVSKTTDWQALYQADKTNYLLTCEMLIDVTEANFLCFLLRAVQAKNILEIGMFTGYTAAALALASQADAHVYTIEREPYLQELALQNFKKYNLEKKISIINSVAADAILQFTQPFDFIFIDADKNNYLNYYQLLIDNQLLSPKGIMCIDNTLMKSSVFCSEVTHPHGQLMKEFNQFILSDSRVQHVLLPIRDGLTLVQWAATSA